MDMWERMALEFAMRGRERYGGEHEGGGSMG